MSARLVFLFVVRKDLLQRRLWEEFFADADPGLYDCLYYSIGGTETPEIRNLVAFENTLNPQHGDHRYVRVVLGLLQHGLRDPRNRKFVLLSESCIPIRGFRSFYEDVMGDDASYLYHFQVGTGDEQEITNDTPTEYPDEAARSDADRAAMFRYFFGRGSIGRVNDRFDAISDKTGLDRRTFHKFQAQGICFEREFARLLVDTQDDLEAFRKVRYVDEHYYLCPLSRRGIPFDRYVRRRCLMAVEWLGSNPKRYASLSREEIDRMRSREFLLMRKVPAECAVGADLTAHILERGDSA